MLGRSVQRLPFEVLEYIISFLDPQSINRISKVRYSLFREESEGVVVGMSINQ